MYGGVGVGDDDEVVGVEETVVMEFISGEGYVAKVVEGQVSGECEGANVVFCLVYR